jgi:hypothetical protein
MKLRAFLRSAVAAICILGVSAPTVSISAEPRPVSKSAKSKPRKAAARKTAPPPAAPRSVTSAGLQVRVAQAPDFTRLEFPGSRGMQARREGTSVVLRFPRDANPNLSSLNLGPPRWVKGAQARHVGGGVEIVVALSDDADFRAGNDEGDDFINLFARQQAAQTAPVAAGAPTRLNPMPSSGVVPVRLSKVSSQVQLSFEWANPAGAAVFRRGEAVWVVFDAPARLDIGKLPASTAQYRNIQAFKGPDYAALRISTPQGAPFYADGVGSSWTIALGAGTQDSPDLVRVGRDENVSPATLSANVAGTTKIVWVGDPAVGDRIAVATALAPSKGLPSRREYVEMALLQSATGVAAESYSGDLQMTAVGDIVRIGRPNGLLLSSSSSGQALADAGAGAPQAMSMPALIDPEHWSKTGSGGFMTRYDALLSAVSTAGGVDGKSDDTAARMALARFLVGSNLSFEAIGVLNAAGRAHQSLMGDGEFRGLRGAAKAMAGRYAEAETDFASPVLAGDPSAAMWRGYIASKTGQWADANQRFSEAAYVLNMFPALWQARFLGAQAEAAVGVGAPETADPPDRPGPEAAQHPGRGPAGAAPDPGQGLRGQERRPRPAGVPGDSRCGIDRLAAPATLHAIQLRLAKNQISADIAAKGLDPCASAGAATGSSWTPSARWASCRSSRAAIARRWRCCTPPTTCSPTCRRPSPCATTSIPPSGPCSSTAWPTACSRSRRWACSTTSRT